MLARDQRTPFSEWWWTVDKLLLAAILALVLGGVILSLAASPPVATRIGLDPFHFFNRHVMFLLPSFIVLIGVSFCPRKYPPRRAPGVRGLDRADRGDACVRRRGQGIAALDHAARRQHPGLRIRKARFRRDRGMAVCGIDQAPGNAGDLDGDGAAVAAGVAAGDGAGFRPDHADPDGVGRAVLHRGHADDLGGGSGGRRRRRIVRRLFAGAACRRSHQALHEPRLGRHVPGRYGDGSVLERRLVRAWARRRHRQAQPAGQPY